MYFDSKTIKKNQGCFTTKVTIVVTCGREGGVEAKKREWGDLPECGTVTLVDLTVAMTLVLTINKSLSYPSLL